MDISVLINVCCVCIILSQILSIQFINFKLNVIMLYKTNLYKIKIIIFYMFYIKKEKGKNERNKLCLSFSIPTPSFPLFYYLLGANLGLLLYGDVSVIGMFLTSRIVD